MAKSVKFIEATIGLEESIDSAVAAKPKKRVAAYARVSTEQDEQQNSYETQISYYTRIIMDNPDWEFVEVYSDEGISGTSLRHRKGFNRMVADALDGKIDLILVKSISRFSRNTVDSLSVARQLKEAGVEIRFEKENISSFDSAAELVFTMLSSSAQEESRSLSENIRWAHRRRMERGETQVAFSRFLGYGKGQKKDQWIIVEEEAKIVREIYDLFLNDHTINWIAKHLTERGVPTPGDGKKWYVHTVRSILSNEKYKGDALIGKTYTNDFLDKKPKKNTGQKPQAYATDHHDGIISPETFDLVQKKLAEQSRNRLQVSNNSPFTTKVICADCGGFFGRKVKHSNDKYRTLVWQCNHRYVDGKTCKTPIINETVLQREFLAALAQEVARIRAGNGPVRPSPEETAGRTTLLLTARDKAREAAEAATDALSAYVHGTSGVKPGEDFLTTYNSLKRRAEDTNAALELAKEAVLEFFAGKENLRRFAEATDILDPEKIEYSDELVSVTLEKVTVSVIRNGCYKLGFWFRDTGKITRTVIV